MKHPIVVSVILAVLAFSACSKPPPPAAAKHRKHPWTPIALDARFQTIWKTYESGFRAFAQIGSLNPDADAFSRLDNMMMRQYGDKDGLTAEDLVKRYGEPIEKIVSDGFVWYSYGPIHLGARSGEPKITDVEVAFSLLKEGIVATAKKLAAEETP